MHRRRLVVRRRAAGLCPQCGGELTAVPRTGGYKGNGSTITYCAKCRGYFPARWRNAD
jgi:Zn-finger nucleic acid-binding protein